jgi:hypothetical protein
LSFLWHPPQKTKQNGVIISYTACVSRSQNGPCFQKFVTSEREWLVGNLNTSTKYYVRVLASTKVGHGPYSTSKGYFTNGRKFDMHVYIEILFVVLRKILFRNSYFLYLVYFMHALSFLFPSMA